MGCAILRAGVLAVALFAAPACAQSAPAPAVETIALDLSGPRPTAQLRIGGVAPVTAIFDTGAAASVLRIAFANRLGLRNEGAAQASGPGGVPIPGFRTTISGALGDAHFGSAMAVALDIPPPVPADIDAVISPAVFSGRLVRFDFAFGAAFVLAKTPANIPTVVTADPYFGSDSRDHIGRKPAARVTLPNGQSLAVVADTGSPSGLRLPLAMAQSLPLAAPLAPADPVRFIGAAHNAFHAVVRGTLRVGPLEFHDADVAFVEGDFEPMAGMQVLRNAILVLDPAEHRSWLLAPTQR